MTTPGAIVFAGAVLLAVFALLGADRAAHLRAVRGHRRRPTRRQLPVRRRRAASGQGGEAMTTDDTRERLARAVFLAVARTGGHRLTRAIVWDAALLEKQEYWDRADALIKAGVCFRDDVLASLADDPEVVERVARALPRIYGRRLDIDAAEAALRALAGE